ncbi:MAG: hypothetical protein LBN97_04985 [Oscillospiraceae bacterium]|jgi:hypothetical protein|nr:hypothetical protein [Oscillospiraceae bacterium]
MRYKFADYDLDSVELKCLLVSRGVKADREVYSRFSSTHRLDASPLTCNCIILSDGTIVQMTDMKFHLNYLNGALSWDKLKLLRYASELGTPFRLRLFENDKLAVFYDDEFIDFVTFPDYSDFYKQKTSGGLPFMGNAVLQGLDWVSFQCLWSCEFAAAGKPCQFCFSGAEFESLARKGKPQSAAVSPEDFAEIVSYAIANTSARNVQITGGSTFSGKSEASYIRAYLCAVNNIGRERVDDILLYITPPESFAQIDEYFKLGASRIACSLEVWDENLAAVITPGKISFTTRKRHLDVLEYAADKYGKGAAFSNFIIGIEPFESIHDGARYLAERGIIPTASIWMPMGRPVMGTMKAPDVSYYRRVIDLFGELYAKYGLEPAGVCGLNVCMERDIWRCKCKTTAV